MVLFDLLIMRAFLLNAVGGVLVWIGYEQGLLQRILSMDGTYISESIIAVFLFGLVLCLYRILECSKALNHTRLKRPSSFPPEYDDFTMYCARRRNPIDVTARLLFRAGLLGTVYGFLMAMAEINVANLTSANMAGQEIGVVIANMSIALVTTLTGAATNIWLVLNQRMLEGGYEQLYQEM